MPRFRPKGVFERSAVLDLWKNTLSNISTRFERLTYLASVRDPNTGVYRHYGLANAFGRDESIKALRSSHEQIFLEWIGSTLEEKYLDLQQFLAGLDESRKTVAEYWLQRAVTLVPDSAREMERELFCKDLEALLEIIRNAGAAKGRSS